MTLILGGQRPIAPCLSLVLGVDPLFLNVRPHSMGETRFLFVLLENHLKKRFGVATYFCFILKGKNKIRKKNPKCDS